MHHRTIEVLDLTSRLGLYSLEKLGVSVNESDLGTWPQLPLGPHPRAHRLHWHRPGHDGPLPLSLFGAVAMCVLVGPGYLQTLDKLLRQWAGTPTQPCWFVVAPNALLERNLLQHRLPQLASPAQLLQLPGSDPQIVWLVLSEQFHKLPEPVQAADEGPFTSIYGEDPMSSNLNQSMDAALTIDGAVAAALVDVRTGMCLAKVGTGINLDLAAAGNSEVVKAKLKTMEMLGIRKGIEDILITLADQYHLIRLVPNNPGLFLYLVLDKAKGNLALARYKLSDIERGLRV